MCQQRAGKNCILCNDWKSSSKAEFLMHLKMFVTEAVNSTVFNQGKYVGQMC